MAKGRCLVAASDGGVLGYVSWRPRGFVGNPLVTCLCVREDARRRGVGRTLLDAARARIGPVKTFVSTEVGNEAMRALLPRLGWVEAGTVAKVNADGEGEGETFYVHEGSVPEGHVHDGAQPPA